MSAVVIKKRRENLFREISNVLQKWPDLDRRVFALAHYYGQSPESISHSLQVDEKKIDAILEQCDQKLHTSLRGFRMGGIDKTMMIQPLSAGPAVRDLAK